jgi:hypothetical protein
MITAIIIAIVFAFGALICYAAVCAGARADRMSERYREEHKNELHGRSEK